MSLKVEKMFEHIPSVGTNPEQKKEQELLKERLFERLVEGEVYDVWEREMSGAGYTPKDIEEVREYFTSVTEGQRSQLLALPWDLRKKIIPQMLKMKKDQGVSITETLAKITKHHSKFERKMAYHVSNNKIEPREMRTGSIKEKQWVISGTEKDHRDNDRPMAYYSFDYKHLYREKNPKYLYFVTASTASNSGHRTDGVEWGRANGLDVISRLDLKEVDTKLEQMMQNFMQANKKKYDIAA